MLYKYILQFCALNEHSNGFPRSCWQQVSQLTCRSPGDLTSALGAGEQQPPKQTLRVLIPYDGLPVPFQLRCPKMEPPTSARVVTSDKVTPAHGSEAEKQAEFKKLQPGELQGKRAVCRSRGHDIRQCHCFPGAQGTHRLHDPPDGHHFCLSPTVKGYFVCSRLVCEAISCSHSCV